MALLKLDKERRPRVLLVPPPDLPVPAVQGGAVQDGAMRAARADGAGGARGAGRRGQAKMCGCGGQVCPAGRAAAESRERPWETVDCLHNIVNCTPFMLKSLLAMWKNGFHNADSTHENRQPVQFYPYSCRNVR